MKAQLSNQMIETLLTLASPPKVQIKAFPTFVVVPDEIVLLFFDQLQLQDVDSLDEESRASIHAIDSIFQDMSRAGTQCWSDSSLAADQSWKRIRAIARRVLARLGVEERAPDLWWLQYAEGG